MIKCLAQGHSVTAGIRTHILLLTPELESGKLDRSATTLHGMANLDRVSTAGTVVLDLIPTHIKLSAVPHFIPQFPSPHDIKFVYLFTNV